jgi:2-polyprenyl-3-methyl-5-hydroxy-6-metoxy-1,4-benzoquinol methylase
MAGTKTTDHPIPRGNTAPGVNLEIIEYLQTAEAAGGDRFTALDVPCGNGEFLNALIRIFPGASITGSDIKTPPDDFQHRFVRFDASRNEFSASEQFDLITCISGLMEFDNTSFFLSGLRKVLKDDGLLIVTNDNILSVRDRILYLLFGRFGQFPLFTAPRSPTWKIIPIQNLLRILDDVGFEVDDVRFVAPSPAEWLWAPLALILFISQRLYLLRVAPNEMVRKIFTFRSLLSRHYVLICKKLA